MLHRLFACVTALMLAGCQVAFESEIYVQDVFADENLTFPAQLKVEINSCSSDKRAETDAAVLALFSKESEATLVGCKEVGMNSMLSVDFVAMLSSKQSDSDLLFLREVGDEYTGLRVVLNPQFLSRVNGMLKKNYQSLDYDDLHIRFTVHNDERKPVSVGVVSGWMNGQAGQQMTTTLKRREKVDIMTSNVVSALALKAQKPLIAVLKKE